MAVEHSFSPFSEAKIGFSPKVTQFLGIFSILLVLSKEGTELSYKVHWRESLVQDCFGKIPNNSALLNWTVMSLEWGEYSSLYTSLFFFKSLAIVCLLLHSFQKWDEPVNNRDNEAATETTILTPYFPNSPWRDPQLLPWPVWNPICSFLDNPWATSPLPGDETGWHHPRQCFPICKEGNTMKICIL